MKKQKMIKHIYMMNEIMKKEEAKLEEVWCGSDDEHYSFLLSRLVNTFTRELGDFLDSQKKDSQKWKI